MKLNLRTALVVAAVCVAAGSVWLVNRPRSANAPHLNSYIDARQCKSCHSKMDSSYQHAGMAHSFALASHASPIEDYEHNNQFVHPASGRHYQMLRRGNQFFQRRYELDSHGKESNVFEQQVTYAIGSGNHARTYLHRSEIGELTELPVTWYPQENRWGMSPGFDNAAPPDFTRLVDERCLFCHTAYPAPDGALAEGIDCQRCHGPGARHVQLASSGTSGRPEILAAIVNPAKLNPERQMDVCMQCHLETTSAELPSMIRRFDREAYSFKPGEALGAYMVEFDEAPGTGRANKFEIVNQAYRLRQSQCFLKSAGRLTCTTCHNPHALARGEAAAPQYRAVCVNCHSQVAVAGHPDLQNANCVSCHMPRRRTQDAVHVVMTDHLIQRKPPSTDLKAALPENVGHPHGRPVLYYPERLSETERELYLGAALITGSADRRQGIQMLERQVQTDGPAKALAVLGEGHLAEGNASSAVTMFRRALAKNPAMPKARYNLGQALEALGQVKQAQEEYEQAIRIRPGFPEAEDALANLLMKSGEGNAAAEHYRSAARARWTYPETHNNLGNLYADQGKLEKARGELEEALRINPGFEEAHNNLGRVLAAQHLIPQALEHLRRAVALNPDYAEARYNLARLLQETGAVGPAIAEYRRTLVSRPDFAAVHLSLGQALGDAGQLEAAIAEFQEVLRLRPGHAEAQRNLDMALTMRRGGSR